MPTMVVTSPLTMLDDLSSAGGEGGSMAPGKVGTGDFIGSWMEVGEVSADLPSSAAGAAGALAISLVESGAFS